MAWDARYVVPANLGFPIFLVLLAYGLWKLGAQHHIVGPSGWHALGDTNYAAIWRAFSLANGQMIFQGLLATDYGRFADRNIRYRGTASIMLATAVSQIFLSAQREQTQCWSLVGAWFDPAHRGSPWFRVSGDVVLAGHAASRAVA